ncbi:alkaline ceramidase 1 isoform X2 [Scyliorhinus canicula]|uniref:alkaline ceramidase 1 isoform X2 n=1 Tax=Scyliorhinus canicula TaxID=7830 RepID=UPI0018F5ABEE|nr:alkaline ceramidase 1 isoform X2 [Scyliorhinus canicula]
MANVFAYQSSQIDWCEDNFQFSEKVAEFYNTISSVSFFISSPIMMYLLHPYAQKRNRAVYLIWVLIMLVGLFSAYYHMTLSYFGQLLDELSILWVLAIGYMLWFPRRHLPTFIKSRKSFSLIVFLTALLSTILSVFRPTVNAYALNSVAFHIIYVISLELKRHVLINIAVVHGTTLFAYFDAFYEIPETNPEVKYWPIDSGYLGLPYLAIQTEDNLRKSC